MKKVDQLDDEVAKPKGDVSNKIDILNEDDDDDYMSSHNSYMSSASRKAESIREDSKDDEEAYDKSVLQDDTEAVILATSANAALD